jgi:hypothetical protein
MKVDRLKMRLGGGPPRSSETEYMARISGLQLGCNPSQIQDASSCVSNLGRLTRRKGRCAYEVKHMVGALRAATDLVSAKRLKTNVANVLKYVMPHRADDLLKELEHDGLQHPVGVTLDRNVVRLDVACMLLSRSAYTTRGPYFRYVTYDASRVHGIEVFNTLEDYVEQSAVFGKTLEEIDQRAIKTRMLPCVTLASGCVATPDKVMSYQHQTWLMYGCTAGHHYAANDDLRLAQSDGGVESFIVDYRDVVSEYYNGCDAAVAVAEPREYMFKNAFGNPGPMHSIDWCLVRALERLEGWPQWVSSAQALTAFCRETSYRDAMKRLLLKGLEGSAVDAVLAFDLRLHAKAVRYFSATLADWRWHTASVVSTQLLRFRLAFKLLEQLYGSSLRKLLGVGKSSMYLNAEAAWTSDGFWCTPPSLPACCDCLTTEYR